MISKKIFLGTIVIIILSFFIGLAYLSKKNAAPTANSGFAFEQQLALIRIEGVIMGGNSGFSSEKAGADTIMRALRAAKDDKNIKGVLLRIDSPGGSAPAAQEIAEEVKKIRDMGKPVVVSMGDTAASGGYWIAACADKVYANPATITGSIGVYISYMNWQELFNKIGVSEDLIKSGPHKDILSPNRPMTIEEKQIVQEIVNELYMQFVTVVSEGRKMDIETVKKLADGRFYSGSQAKKLGLVDELGDFYDAVDYLTKAAKIDGKAKLKEYNKFEDIFDVFASAKSNVPLELLFNNGIFRNISLINNKTLISNKYDSRANGVLADEWQEGLCK